MVRLGLVQNSGRSRVCLCFVLARGACRPHAAPFPRWISLPHRGTSGERKSSCALAGAADDVVAMTPKQGKVERAPVSEQQQKLAHLAVDKMLIANVTCELRSQHSCHGTTRAQSQDIHNALLNAADKLRYQFAEEAASNLSVGTALRTLWNEVPRAEETRQLQVRLLMPQQQPLCMPFAQAHCAAGRCAARCVCPCPCCWKRWCWCVWRWWSRL